MQKLIAILFVFLLCSTTLMQGLHLPVDAVEQMADSDKGKDAQPEKKEGKEFLAGYPKRTQAVAPVIYYYTHHISYWLPQPVLSKPTPPPDVVC